MEFLLIYNNMGWKLSFTEVEFQIYRIMWRKLDMISNMENMRRLLVLSNFAESIANPFKTL